MEKNIKKESWCDRNVPPMLQTWEEALSDLDESEKEFERGDVLTDEEFNTQCQALIKRNRAGHNM